MKKGAYDFITKPFQRDPFLLVVRRAVEKRKLEQRARAFERENIRNLYDLGLEKSRLKTIIQCMANGVMVTNRNLEDVLHNPAFLRLMGITGKVHNPVPVTDIISDKALVDSLRRIQRGEVSEQESLSQEIQVGKHSLRAISAPVPGPDDSAVGTVTVLEDVTPFRQLDQMKSDFINMVAHELRSPLVSIRQIDSVLLEGLGGPLEDKQKELLNRSLVKIDALLDLINDLLEMARLEAGEHVQHRVPTQVDPIIENTVALMAPRAKEQGVTLSFASDGPPPVSADPKQLEELFTNLISNAVNYSPDGGRVTITAGEAGEFVRVTVADRGVGIPADELPKIFDRFYRVKHPKTRRVMGTGLGLSIVKGIVETHGGTVDVESEPGKGTTFQVLLPALPR
jgi:signal transduction histidine kinase